MIWKDTTTYSRNEDRKTAEPRVWELSNSDLRITVHRWLHLPGWFCSCYELGIEREELKATDIEKAKVEALELVQKKLTKYQAFINKILKTPKKKGDRQ